MLKEICLIEQMIQLTYPIEKKERCCAIYKAKMNAKREALRQRLMNDNTGKKAICGEQCEGQSQVSENALS